MYFGLGTWTGELRQPPSPLLSRGSRQSVHHASAEHKSGRGPFPTLTGSCCLLDKTSTIFLAFNTPYSPAQGSFCSGYPHPFRITCRLPASRAGPFPAKPGSQCLWASSCFVPASERLSLLIHCPALPSGLSTEPLLHVPSPRPWPPVASFPPAFLSPGPLPHCLSQLCSSARKSVSYAASLRAGT